MTGFYSPQAKEYEEVCNEKDEERHNHLLATISCCDAEAQCKDMFVTRQTSDISLSGSLALETSEPRPQRQIRQRMRGSVTGEGDGLPKIMWLSRAELRSDRQQRVEEDGMVR